MRLRPPLLAIGSCLLTASCDRRPPPPAPASSVTVRGSDAPVVSPPLAAVSTPAPSLSAPPAGSAPATPTVPTTVTATRWLVGLPGGLTTPLTLLRTEPGGGAVLLNETTGDFLVGTARDEGDQVAVQASGLALVIDPPTAVRPGALRWAPGVSVALRRAPSTTAPATAAARRFVGGDGASFEVAPDERARRAWYEAAPRPGDPPAPPGAPRQAPLPFALVHQGGWRLATPSLPAPRTSVFGGQKIRAEEPSPGRSLGCVVHGLAPVLEGTQTELVREAWQGWVRDRCTAAGANAVIELSYSLVALVGVNLMTPSGLDTPANPAFRGGPVDDRSPTSATVMPINLLARVTTEAGSELVEEALLLDTRAGTCPRLGALVAPKNGATTLERSALETLTSMAGWLPREQRAAAVSLADSHLTVGPTSVDVVMPLRPFGIALPSRHLFIGPRSTLAGAFTSSAATARLTAALFVDY